MAAELRRRPGRARAGLSALWQADRALQPLLIGFVLLQLAAMLWDQPCFYGWENDGVAPRGLFGGIAENLTPGHADRYPLLHSLVLGLLALPVLVVDALAVLGGGSLFQRVIGTHSMTAIAVLAKTLHVGMSGVSLLAFARIFAQLFSQRAARWGVALAMLNLSFSYYARATNVDVAYLMWVTLWLDCLLRFARERERGQLPTLGLFAAAALATKDQAYASFVLPALLFWGLLLPGGWRERAGVLGDMLRVALPAYLLLSGALFNPTGFVQRVQNLLGPNSQDWRQYPASATGLLENLRALFWSQQEYWWPWPALVAAWLGVLFAPRLAALLAPETHATAGWRCWLLSWLPLSLGISATLAFTLPVGRAEHRFMLPLGFWLSGYAGALLASLGRSRRGGWLSPVCGAASLALAAAHSAQLVVTQWCDPRRDVERFLARLPAGTRVEAYGHGVYLPRFDLSATAPYRVTRVNGLGSGTAPPIAGVRDIRDDYAALERRRADVLVIPGGFARRFAAERGRPAMEGFRQAPGALELFRGALQSQLPHYRLLSVGELDLPAWFLALGGQAVRIHGSTGERTWVFQRVTSEQAVTQAPSASATD